MPRIKALDIASATGPQAAAIEAELHARGKMTSLKWAQAHSPEVLRIYGEWFTLHARLVPAVGVRGLNIFCLAVCEAQGSVIPTGYFRRALVNAGSDPDRLERSSEEDALHRFGTIVGERAGHVPDDLWNALATRYGELVMVDLAGFAGQMVATTVLANLLQVEPDEDVLAFLKPVKA